MELVRVISVAPWQRLDAAVEIKPRNVSIAVPRLPLIFSFSSSNQNCSALNPNVPHFRRKCRFKRTEPKTGFACILNFDLKLANIKFDVPHFKLWIFKCSAVRFKPTLKQQFKLIAVPSFASSLARRFAMGVTEAFAELLVDAASVPACRPAAFSRFTPRPERAYVLL